MSSPALPAHNVEIEQALLGALMMNNDAIQSVDGLRPDHFYEPVHRLLFEGMQTLIHGGKSATPLTLKMLLPNDLMLAGITASQYLARIAVSATSVINTKDYAADLRALAQIREMVAILGDAARFDQRQIFPIDAVREVYHRLDTLRLDHPTRNSVETAAHSSAEFIDWMAGVMRGEVRDQGVSSGISEIDRVLGGLKGGNLIILAGRPGMGKSTIATTLMRNVARRAAMSDDGAGVGMFSLEMNNNQLMARVHCDEAFDDPSGDIITYNQALNPSRFLSVPQGERLLDAQRRIAGLPLMLDFSSSLTVGEIAARARGMAMRLHQKFGRRLGLLIVDYIKQVKASDRYFGNRTAEVGEITSGMKQIAKDLNVPLVLLVQLNRKVEEREEKIPLLSDLRESGDIEQDADSVVFVYREAYYLQNSPKISQDVSMQVRLQECINRALLCIGKNRHGPTGNIEVFCHMGACAVRNLAQPEEIPIT